MVSKSDVIFGVAKENAPPRRMVDEAEPVMIHLPPGISVSQNGASIVVTFGEASMLHYELGQTLARMMRKRGSSTPPGGDIGGTPVAVAA